MPENSMEKHNPAESELEKRESLPELGRYKVLDVATFFMGDSAVTLNPGSWFTLERASEDQYLLIFENGPSTVEIYLSPKNVQRVGIKVEKVD